MVEPGEHPKAVMLDNNLDALQKAVSIGCEEQGLIKIIGMEEGICLLCNEEGKLLLLTQVLFVSTSLEEGELAKRQ